MSSMLKPETFKINCWFKSLDVSMDSERYSFISISSDTKDIAEYVEFTCQSNSTCTGHLDAGNKKSALVSVDNTVQTMMWVTLNVVRHLKLYSFHQKVSHLEFLFDRLLRITKRCWKVFHQVVIEAGNIKHQHCRNTHKPNRCDQYRRNARKTRN